MNDGKNAQEYYSLWMTLIRAKDAIHRVRENELKRYQISPEQSGILAYILAMNNDTTPTEISRLSFRKANTVSITLDRMAKKGLVVKRRDRKRRNVVRVSLTKKGKEVHYQASKHESVYQVFSTLSDQEYQQLESCLRILLDKAAMMLNIEIIPEPILS